MGIELHGKWAKGFASELHTISSTHLGVDQFGHNQFDTTRSKMGELVYKLKFNGDRSVISGIIELLGEFSWINQMDYIVPIPSTNKGRTVQPVPEIADALGQHHSVPVLHDLILKNTGGPELKNVDELDKRMEILRSLMSYSGKHDISGKNILLLDDLYRSGATLTVATELLYSKGNVKNVVVLTMTKTRTKR